MQARLYVEVESEMALAKKSLFIREYKQALANLVWELKRPAASRPFA